MKKRIFAGLFLSNIFAVSIAGCNPGNNKSSDCVVDSLKVYQEYIAKHNLFDSTESDLIALFGVSETDSLFSMSKQIDDGEPVPVAEADKCLGEYVKLMDDAGIKDDASDTQRDGKGRLTKDISFKSITLIKWLKESGQLGATEIRVCFGRYNEDFLGAHFPADSDGYKRRKNRMTVFLYPYKNVNNGTGKIASQVVGNYAFDLGGLHP